MLGSSSSQTCRPSGRGRVGGAWGTPAVGVTRSRSWEVESAVLLKDVEAEEDEEGGKIRGAQDDADEDHRNGGGSTGGRR